jgi:predicted aldo/keto reductase-like oxidoreductase
MLLLLQAYHERYHLEDWARQRLAGLDKSYGDCQQCGECIERCPYRLEIPQLIARAADQFG